ncbi:MAG: hypothetical protein V1788_02995 [Nanoarchaeota archaeon]
MKIVFTPDWFLGQDVMINLFSFLILGLFFFFSVKNYKISKNKRLLYLGIGFLLIALAELSVVLTKFAIFYDTDVTQSIGRIIITYDVVKSLDIIYYISLFFNRFFTLLGLYIIYRLPLKRISGDFILVVYFIIITSLLSHNFYYIYHLTALIFLALVTRNYIKIYRENRLANTGIFIVALCLLGMSQVMFILSNLAYIYVMAQAVQLISYITLLILIMRISKNGKKKQAEHNL